MTFCLFPAAGNNARLEAHQGCGGCDLEPGIFVKLAFVICPMLVLGSATGCIDSQSERR